MRLLVITRTPWLEENSLGSTMTDFFSGFTDFEIYGLCLREAPSVTKICKKNFYMSERQIIKALMHKGVVGAITGSNSNTVIERKKEESIYNKAKRYNLTALKLIREIIWSTDAWKNNRLDEYLAEVNPDVVFFPVFPCVYAQKVLKYIYEKTSAKVAIFHADDCYSLKQFSLSPLFWIYRLYQRKWIRSSVRLANRHYVISDIQKREYDISLGVEHKILTKFADFSGEAPIKHIIGDPLDMVYTGNIELNRWKSLAIIVDALKEVNSQDVKVDLKIYTANEITKKRRRAMEKEPYSHIMGKVPASEIPTIQNSADILVHVESFDIKNKLAVRQSFSTKIVDYFKRGRAILAVGPKDVASISHLIDNDCAIVAQTKEQIIAQLNSIIRNNKLLNEYAHKAYECGRRQHNRDDMLKMLHDDLSSLIK